MILTSSRQMITRRALVGAALASLAVPLRAQLLTSSLRPEDFGAAGDGTTNDAAAFARLLSEASRTGATISLGERKRYAVGSRGWQGLDASAAAGIAIEGNGATILFKARPRQRFTIGDGFSFIRFSGGRVTVRDLHFDLGGLGAAALDLDRCQVQVERCSFTNGERSVYSYALLMNRSSGTVADNVVSNIGFFAYLGHTDSGYRSRDFKVLRNRGSNLAYDFVVGIVSGLLVQDNVCDGMYGGVANGGYDKTGAFSENISVIGNRFSNYRAQAVQSDIVGDIFNRNVTVRGNHFSSGGNKSAAVYLIRVNGFDVRDNVISNSQFGIIADKASTGVIANNKIDAAGRGESGGIRLVGEVGAVRAVTVTGNEIFGYNQGIAVGGSRSPVRDIRLENNRITGGKDGIAIWPGAAAVSVTGNILSGNRNLDLDIRVPDIPVSRNSYRTSN